MIIRWIDEGEVGYLRSQALYHGLARAQNNTSNTILLARPKEAYVCIGYFQDAYRELDVDYCRSVGLPIVRRQTGGGAVLIDDGQEFIQWIFRPESVPARVDHRFRLFIKPMVETYKFFGIDAYGYRDHDVHVDGKKLVGTGAAHIGHSEVITGNFLYDFDTRLMSRVLNLPGQGMREVIFHNLEQYMTTLRSEVQNLDEKELKKVYKKKCREILNVRIEDGSLTDEEEVEIARFEQKLADDKWTFAGSKPGNNCRVVKIHTGIWVANYRTQNGSDLDLTLTLDHEKIKQAVVKKNEKTDKTLGDQLAGQAMDPASVRAEVSKCCPDEKETMLTEWEEAIASILKEKAKLSGGG